MKINKKQFNRWLQALYNEEMPQTTGSLQKENGYCCLGVACKLFIPKSKLELKYGGLMGGSMPQSQEYAPEWLKDISSKFKDESGESLDKLNDKELMTFPEIAMCLDLVYNHNFLK